MLSASLAGIPYTTFYSSANLPVPEEFAFEREMSLMVQKMGRLCLRLFYRSKSLKAKS